MDKFFDRTEMLLGSNSEGYLQEKYVAVFGLGGVGSYAAEALARCAIGNFLLVDGDIIDESNINRQIIADVNTVGRAKVDVMSERILAINPKAKIKKCKLFYSADSKEPDLSDCDYIVDAIDTMSAKIHIVEQAQKKGIPIISAMSAGNKLDPTKFEVSDIYKTSVCPMCKIMRRELEKRRIEHLKVVYSKEKLIKTEGKIGSISFVPPVMGMIMAGEVIKDIMKINSREAV